MRGQSVTCREMVLSIFRSPTSLIWSQTIKNFLTQSHCQSNVLFLKELIALLRRGH